MGLPRTASYVWTSYLHIPRHLYTHLHIAHLVSGRSWSPHAGIHTQLEAQEQVIFAETSGVRGRWIYSSRNWSCSSSNWRMACNLLCDPGKEVSDEALTGASLDYSLATCEESDLRVIAMSLAVVGNKVVR